MKVRDVIAALMELDPDLPVIMPSHVMEEFVEVETLFLDVMAPSEDGGLELCDYEDEGCVTVARLFEAGDHDDRAERPKSLTS